ncbi:PspC domain-containing protein [Nocardioides sp.]|uniref:PspC domain-containing protein n=1 Tax=Nocardioides sp. TaxID=35761 RepID=UPI00286D16D0|nr:PspC domain-containing protein [Nocardioides sp.]
MTTTPPDAPTGTPPGSPPGPGDGQPHDGPHDGPRVSRDQVRDLGRLRRSAYDRKVAGVAGGLARHLDVDPIILRVGFVVLAFFGGAGILLYGACWLLVPDEGTGDATVRLDERSRSVALIVVGALAALALLGDSLGGFGFPWPLAIIGLVVLLVVSNRGQESRRQARATPTYAPPTYAPPTYFPTQQQAPTSGHPSYAGAPPTWTPVAPAPLPPRPRNPRRRGPILFWFTLALCALGVGVLGILDLAGAPISGAAYPALVLATTGVMLLVGAFFGRAGGLILVGLMAGVATAGATAAQEVDADRIDAAPRSAAQVEGAYELFAGEIVLDLSDVADLEGLDGRTVRVESVFGRIEVIVPEGLDVDVRSTIDGGGHSELFGADTDGSDSRFHDGGTDAPVLVLDTQVVFGEIVVDTEERLTR